jgi:hypothetical protein
MTDLAKRYEGCYLNINMNELGLHTSHRLKKLQTTEKMDLIQATFLLLDYDKLLYMLGGGGCVVSPALPRTDDLILSLVGEEDKLRSTSTIPPAGFCLHLAEKYLNAFNIYLS